MRWKLTAGAVVLAAAALARAGGTVARADELRPPQNVHAEPWTRQSSELATRSAKAEMQGMPQQALALADQAIKVNPQDPWPYYDKGMALARLGQTDAAVASLTVAEQRFSPADRWGRSVAIYGRANTLALAGRCAEARQAFEQYAAFVEAQAPDSAAMARRYGNECRAPATPPAAGPSGAAAPGATAAPPTSPAAPVTPAPAPSQAPATPPSP
jgi:tetratricopeptide (TPR) repeat protein